MMRSTIFFCIIFLLYLLSSFSYSINDSRLNQFQSIYLSEDKEPSEDDKRSIGSMLEDNLDDNEEEEEMLRKQREINKNLPKHPLSLSTKDIRLKIVKTKSNIYYDLVIKKKPNIASVLLTNYYWKDANKVRVQEYGLRAIKPNFVNSDEKRLYKNTFIGKEDNLYFLVDSTTEEDPQFKEAFRIRIPLYIIYGYKKSKEIYGILRVRNGVRMNIRTFSRKYADYKGNYYDNPIGLVLNKQRISNTQHIIKKLGTSIEADYFNIYIKYESDHAFFRAFLVREDGADNFVEVDFSKHKEDRNAILIEAFYKGSVKKTVKAKIYFRRRLNDAIYHIIALDKEGNYSIKPIRVIVPGLGQSSSSDASNIDPSMDPNAPENKPPDNGSSSLSDKASDRTKSAPKLEDGKSKDKTEGDTSAGSSDDPTEEFWYKE